jgi:hypothetical protein
MFTTNRTSSLEELRRTHSTKFTTPDTMVNWISTAMADLHARGCSTLCGDVLREIRRTRRSELTTADTTEFRTGEEIWMSTAWDAKRSMVRDGVLVQNADGDPWALVGQVGRSTDKPTVCQVCFIALPRHGQCVNCV